MSRGSVQELTVSRRALRGKEGWVDGGGGRSVALAAAVRQVCARYSQGVDEPPWKLGAAVDDNSSGASVQVS